MQTVNSIASELVRWYDLPRASTVGCVVDPCTDENLSVMGAGITINSPHVFSIKLVGTDVSVNERPALVVFEKTDWLLRQTSIEKALLDLNDANPNRFISGWFASSLHPQDLVRKLSVSMDSRLINSKRTLLRHHDPRVRQYVEAIVGNQWLQSLVPGVIAWGYLRHDCQWSAWTDVPEVTDESALTPLIKKVLLQSAEVNRVIQLASQEKIKLDSHVYSVIHQAFDKTEKYGYINQDDRLAFALHSLMMGLGFETRSQVATALSQADNGTNYCDAIAHLSPQQWGLINHEANSS